MGNYKDELGLLTLTKVDDFLHLFYLSSLFCLKIEEELIHIQVGKGAFKIYMCH